MYNILFLLIPIFYIIIRSKKNLHILQQNFYNENNRYIKWGIKKLSESFKVLDIVLLIINGLNLIWKNSFFLWLNLGYILLFIIDDIAAKKAQVKIPLKVTNRMKRLIVTTSIFYLLSIIFFLITKKIYITSFFMALLISLNFYVVELANIINKPAEKYVFFHYKRMAMKKLKSMPVEVIGITGSYGKTSSKNILNDILGVKFNPLATPKNYNTQYGLILTINNMLNKFHDIFIAEMGAFKMGRINLLCKLVKPKYGIITKIGEAHLETFGSKENIQKGKFELIENLPSDGLAILNKDDEMQTSYKIKNNVKVIWIGIDNTDADVMAKNIKIDNKGMSFDVYFKDTKEEHHFTTKLLGKANIYNILAGIAFGRYKNMTLQELDLGVKRIETIEHRLELKAFKDFYIIDDAYNSNPIGSKMALDVLKLMKGQKIVVTPGMIELGPLEYELNKKFGEYISEVADFCILVGKKQTQPIYDGLKEKGYKEEKIRIINDVKEAFTIAEELHKKDKDTFVLLENDLPDIFNE